MDLNADAYIVLIHVEGRAKPIGTGFLVHSDGLIATCYHIIRDIIESPNNSDTPQKLRWASLPKESLAGKSLHEGKLIITGAQDPQRDVALLRMESLVPEDMRPVRLITGRDHAIQGASFAITGYAERSEPKHTYQYAPALGKIKGYTSRDSIEVIELESIGLLRGMSGGAVVIHKLGGVVGMMSARFNADPKEGPWGEATGFAVKSKSIVELDPRLILHLVGEPDSDAVARLAIEKAGQTGSLEDLGLHLDWKRPLELGRAWTESKLLLREEFTAKVIDHLDPIMRAPGGVALYGMTGMGKTVVASNLVRLHHSKFIGGVLWANLGNSFAAVDRTGEIFAQWADYAYGGTGQVVGAQRNGKLTIQPAEMRRLLSGRGPMLVILDNVVKFEHISSILDALPPDAYVLVTTQSQAVADKFVFVQIDSLSSEESLTLLRKRQKLTAVPDLVLIELANYLGRHPFALEVVAESVSRKARPTEAVKQLVEHARTGMGFEPMFGGNYESSRAFSLAVNSCYEDLDGNEHRERLKMLGVLSAVDSDFDSELAAGIWQVSVSTAESTLEEFASRAIVEQTGSSTWNLPAIIREYTSHLLKKCMQDEQARLNAIYVEAVMNRCDSWPEKQVNPVDLPHALHIGGTTLRALEQELQYDPLKLNAREIHARLRGLTGEAMSTLSESLPRRLSFLAGVSSQLVNQAYNHQQALKWLSATLMASIKDGREDTMCWSLFARSRWLIDRGMPTDAVDILAILTERARALSYGSFYGYAMVMLGTAHRLSGQTRQAIRVFEDLADWMDETNFLDEDLLHAMLLGVSAAYLATGRVDNADSILSFVKSRIVNVADAELQSTLEQLTGIICLSKGDTTEALSHFESCLKIAGGTVSPQLVASIEENRAQAFLHQGQIDAARLCCNRAIEAADKLDIPRIKTGSLAILGIIEIGLGNVDDALKYLDAAGDILAESPDANAEAMILTLKAGAYISQGRHSEAKTLLDRTLPLFRESQNLQVGVALYQGFGAVYEALGKQEEGRQFFEEQQQTLDSLEDMGSQIVITSWLIKFGQLSTESRPLEGIDSAKRIVQGIPNPIHRASLQTMLGETFRVTGDFTAAKIALTEALSEFTTLQQEAAAAFVRLVLAELSLVFRNLDEMGDHLREASPFVLRQDNPSLRGTYDNLNIRLLIMRADLRAAETELESRWDFLRGQGDAAIYSCALINRALFQRLSGRPDESTAAFRTAREVITGSGKPNLIASMLYEEGVMLAANGENRNASDLFRQSAEMVGESGLPVDMWGNSEQSLMALSREHAIKSFEESIQDALRKVLAASSISELTFLAISSRDVVTDKRFIDFAHASSESSNEDVKRSVVDLAHVVRNIALNTSLKVQFVSLDARMWMGMNARTERHYVTAREHFEAVLHISSENLQALIECGWACRGTGEIDDATRYFERVISLKSDSADAWLGKGIICYENNDLTAAQALLTKAAQLAPNDPEVCLWKVKIAQSLGEFQLALEEVNRAIEIDPERHDIQYWHAQCLIDLGNFPQARRDLAKLMSLARPDLELWAYAAFWSFVLAKHFSQPEEEAIQRMQVNEYLANSLQPLLNYVDGVSQNRVDNALINALRHEPRLARRAAYQVNFDRAARVLDLPRINVYAI